MAKKITLKNKNGDVLCPHTAIEQVQGLKEALEQGANIEIGGTNLILNSDFSSGTEHWSKLNHGSLSAIEGVATFTLEAVAKGQGMVQTSPVNIVSGQQYTVSFDVRSEDIQTLNYCFLMGVGVGNVSLSWLLSEDVITPEWQRIERTFTATTTGTYMFGFGVQGLAGTEGVIEFQFKKLKIEKGNKATDWSPAPEDVVNGIKIDTRNLLLDSKEITVDGNATTIATSMVRKDLPISIKAGDVFTFNCEELILNTESTVEQHRVIIYESGVSQVSQPAYISPTSRTATLVADRDCAKPVFLLYARDINMSQGNSITYKGATLVKGTKPMLLWQPSVEEVQTQIDSKLPLTGGTLTGNLTAPSFKTNLTSGVAEAVMAYPVNISWGNDLNGETYLKAGMYRTSSATSTVNQPNEKGHSNLLTIRGNESDNIAQMFFDYWNNGKVFTRVGSITVDTTSTSHIFNRDWKQLRTIDDLVTTSHIADTAITSAKLASSLILKGTPQLATQPTLSSESQNIASVGLIKNLKIDTRNLLTNSKEITIDGSALTSGSKYITKKLPISVAVGDVLTFNCEDMIINAGTDQTHGILLYSGGALAAVKYISPTSKTATITVTKASSTPYLYMYAGYSDDSAGKSITYKGATLVKGDKPMLLWQAAPEDLPTKAGVINLISASDLELGAIADATGANSTTTNANRARTAGYIPVTSSQLALKSWTDGVVFYLWTYDANKNPIQMSYSSTGWISSGQAYTLPEGTAYIRLVLKKNSGANFTVSELPTIKIKAEYSNKTTDWYPSLDDVKAAARPTVYKQSTQPSVLTANEGDIWIVS